MEEGGAVNIVKDTKLKVIAESFRDWEEIAGAQLVWITPAKKDMIGNWEICHMAALQLKTADTAAIERIQLRRLRSS